MRLFNTHTTYLRANLARIYLLDPYEFASQKQKNDLSHGIKLYAKNAFAATFLLIRLIML